MTEIQVDVESAVYKESAKSKRLALFLVVVYSFYNAGKIYAYYIYFKVKKWTEKINGKTTGLKEASFYTDT